MRISAIVLLLALAAAGQTLSTPRKTEPVGDAALNAKIKASMKQYLEDLTERDLVIKETITQSDLSGRVVKVDHRERKQKGTSLKKKEGFLAPSMSTQADHNLFGSPGPLFFFEIAHDAAVLPLAVVLSSEDLVHYAVTGSDEGGHLLLHYQSQDKCVNFHTSRGNLQVEYCGWGDVTLDSAAVPQRATFASSKVPLQVKNGTWTVKSWAFEETFQTVAPPDGSTTMILPLALKSTFETDKGNVVIENSYALAPKKK